MLRRLIVIAAQEVVQLRAGSEFLKATSVIEEHFDLAGLFVDTKYGPRMEDRDVSQQISVAHVVYAGCVSMVDTLGVWRHFLGIVPR